MVRLREKAKKSNTVPVVAVEGASHHRAERLLFDVSLTRLSFLSSTTLTVTVGSSRGTGRYMFVEL